MPHNRSWNPWKALYMQMWLHKIVNSRVVQQNVVY